MYRKNVLREYIANSELREFSKKIKVRMSKELAAKYDAGIYQNGLENLQKCYKKLMSLHLQYPANAKPILYVYIVPDDNYGELLNIPSHFNNGNGGGKPVPCYDIDGFNSAYGLSQNLLERQSEDMNIFQYENEIHELSHIIHSQFFNKNQTISEGLAEAIPLYILGLEEKFIRHQNILTNLNPDQILTAQQLLNSEKNNSYGKTTALPNSSCSFRYSYISSYLFIRGCLETIVDKYQLSKAQALQYFLEILKQSDCINEWLIFDIANALGISEDVLLSSKEFQLQALNSIKNMTDDW